MIDSNDGNQSTPLECEAPTDGISGYESLRPDADTAELDLEPIVDIEPGRVADLD